MPSSWNKGKTKETNASVRKISETMKERKIDNFSAWRKNARASGTIATPQELVKNGNLAELIGMILGDGSIHIYDRTEGVRIVLPTKKPGMIERYTDLVETVFGKKPSVIKRKNSECVDIRLYQKSLSQRLGIPAGARGNMEHQVPKWIVQKQDFVIRYLRGLYEAEGCFCTHLPTSTYKLIFSNVNPSLLNIVAILLAGLGFHPHMTRRDVQLSRKEEVYRAMEVLQFGKYKK
ncbi:MAG: LAGLIDADG family homing endonuclease [Minisyncoccia bacterium]